jgi:plastocyanin
MATKRKISIYIIFSVVLLFVLASGSLLIITNAETNNSATIYLSLVNDAFGFYKIRNLETIPRQFTYDDHVLNINIGDTIIWENDADISTLTVVSDQNLWNDQIGMIKVGQKINYKFDKAGIYTFHLKEILSKQTIVVNNLGITPTVEQTMAIVTPVPTEIYKPSHTAQRTAIPTPTTPVPVSINVVPDVKIPIKLTPTSFASIAVGILSIYITFRRKVRK